MPHSSDALTWLRAALYVAYCDGDFSQLEETVIGLIYREWTTICRENADAMIDDEKTRFLACVRSCSKDHSCLSDRVFPRGICVSSIRPADFVANLIAVKLADGVVDEREREAVMDIITLMPAARIPNFEQLRLQARRILHAMNVRA